MRIAFPILCLAPLLALAACKGGDDTALKDKAGGEILPGSVSDAMLPLDTVRSQPPLAPRTESAGGKSRAEADASADAAPASETAEAAPPASTPPSLPPAAASE